VTWLGAIPVLILADRKMEAVQTGKEVRKTSCRDKHLGYMPGTEYVYTIHVYLHTGKKV
jgi:hypothetical protein